jgi:hypothetical protein
VLYTLYQKEVSRCDCNGTTRLKDWRAEQLDHPIATSAFADDAGPQPM